MAIETCLVEVEPRLEDGSILTDHLRTRFPDLTFEFIRQSLSVVLVTDETPDPLLVAALRELLGISETK